LGFGAAAVWRLLQRSDALRKPERFLQMLQVCQHDAQGRTGLHERPYPQRARLAAALAAAQAVDSAAVSAPLLAVGAQGEAIGRAVAAAREHAIAATLQAFAPEGPSA
jgi:tRNA nucleotidyltransferase (CCA-adding enzyme)